MTRLLAEYLSADALVGAVRVLRDQGYRLEAYTPYPMPELDRALAAPRSRLSYAAFLLGIFGAAAAYGGQWLISAYLYPIDVGGRPLHFPLAFVPITFEMGILATALGAFAAVLVLARLVVLWDPLFEVDGFASATGTGFWLEVRAGEPDVDADIRADLAATDPVRIAEAGGPP